MKRWPLRAAFLVAFALAVPLRAAPRAPKTAASAAPPAPKASRASPPPLLRRPWPKRGHGRAVGEHVPTGATRPVLKEQFPRRATSGYAAPLEVTVEHGKGETVLPQGFQTQASSAASRELAEAGFIFPEIEGGAAPELDHDTERQWCDDQDQHPGVAPSQKAWAQQDDIAPVPIAVARASGELLTLCTEPHAVVVEDPTASTPDAKPRDNPAPRQQLEEWVLAKQLAIGAAAGVVLAALLAWLAVWWLKTAANRSAAAAPASAVGGRARGALRGSSRWSRQRRAFRRALRSRLRCSAQATSERATGSMVSKRRPAR